MTFDFFNTSNLAFGKKLTQAFKTLNDLMTASENALDIALENLEYYQQYGKLSYLAPVPTKLTAPVRTDELLNTIAGYSIFSQLQYLNGLLSVKLVRLNKNTDKILLAQGSTELKEGYAFVTPSISNTEAQRNIRFDEDNNPKGSEFLLFQFRIDSKGKIHLGGDIQNFLNYYAYDATQYRSLSKGDEISLPYTAEDYECVCVVGQDLKLEIKVNDKVILSGRATSNRDYQIDHIAYGIVYLKPKDKLSGIYGKAFKVNYNY